jgi:hypothetical protein
MTAVRRISLDRCFGALIDYQDFFLAQMDNRARSKMRANTRNFVRLLGYFRIPIVATLERPVFRKGAVPKEIEAHLGERAKVFEKSFFDLTKEKKIRGHIGRLKKTQAIVAGCETDVCVLQSCLGLLELGHEVYVIEELVFSSARDTQAAVARLRAEGAVFLSYKTLFYELIACVEDCPHAEQMMAKYGEFPEDIPDIAMT